ncbi:hypothetical protein [Secundilactobacillus paracollinoides]|uniref:hypothetical protein n=1 Tax=Secundilactobacillus paracollinoides TaxID=240427 RepID=UPI0006F076EE|nr:hypothetical protein [Secundilactobacillus paracollinoides]KRL79409.1 hypothetical protein FC17_GL000457 [Secundilactobacillus paracollinoides DSM 15502 = JCM 11969]
MIDLLVHFDTNWFYLLGLRLLLCGFVHFGYPASNIKPGLANESYCFFWQLLSISLELKRVPEGRGLLQKQLRPKKAKPGFSDESYKLLLATAFS